MGFGRVMHQNPGHQGWNLAELASPEEGDGDATKDDGAPHAGAILGVARRAHTEDGPPHILLCLLQEQKEDVALRYIC